MAKKWYGVRVGREPGVYETWPDCDKQVRGFGGAIFKSFDNEYDAVDFVNSEPDGELISADKIQSSNKNYAFTDGSFNEETRVYGYGGFLFENGNKHILQGSGNDAEMASMRNVAGEILGAMAAIKKAVALKLDTIYIYYDYSGVEEWAKRRWKRNKKGTEAYANYCASVEDKINIIFVKVKGHTGIDGNEEADVLAKESVGLKKIVKEL